MSRAGRIASIFSILAMVILSSVGQASAAEVLPAPFAGRWIDVNLTTLRATAFQGTKAVYSSGVTTGKAGYRTPTGTYYIFSRYRIQDMQSNPGDPNPYFQPNVEYIQYFRGGGYALHANYWQPSSVFGRLNTSHGCVGMPRSAAIYFWNFAGIGTPVYIHFGATPKATPVVKADSVVGKDVAAARKALQADGLKVAVRNKTTMIDTPGTVLAQSVAGGRTVTKGTTVTLTVAQARALTPTKPAEGDYAFSPDVIGLPEAEAIARIEQAGLRATYVNYFDEKGVSGSAKASLLQVKKGAVFGTLTAVGERLPRGSEYAIAVRRP
jgi:L,D-transpeptidase-like protein/PASTA domain-containing protein